MESALQTYVRVFPVRPAETGRRLRELYDSGPDEFVRMAEEALLQYEPGPGIHYVLGILATHEKLIPALCHLSNDPEFPLAVLMGTATSLEPGLEAKLTKQLERAASQECRCMRTSLMRLLDACRRASNLVPALSRLVQSADDHISSKAVLLAGRSVESPAWFEERLADPEPRVRANAIEALWNSHLPWAVEMLARGARDAHPRVTANAHVGLYLAGRLEGLRGLLEMARHPDASFRTSAAWALGQIGDPRGLPALKPMLSEPPGRITRNALAALRRIGRLQSDRRLGASSIMVCLDSGVSGAEWKALLTFHHPPARELLSETHWLVGGPEGWSPDVKVDIADTGDAPKAVLIGPQLSPFDLAAALSGMQTRVQWAAVRYSPGRIPRIEPDEPKAARSGAILHLDESHPAPKPSASEFEPDPVVTFSPHARHLDLIWQDAANPMRAAASLVHVLEKSFQALQRAGKSRHIVLLAAERLDPVTCRMLPRFGTTARVAGIAIHLLGSDRLAPADREPYLELCRAAGGFNLWTSTPEEMRHAFRSIQAGLALRIRLRVPLRDLPPDRVVVCHQANGHFDEVEVPLAQLCEVN